MLIRPVFCAILAASLAAGCQTTLPGTTGPNLIHDTDEAPPGAAPGTCWGKSISPAVVETLTEQIILQPAEIMDDGTVAQPAIYKTETRQAIVKERTETWFETPCRDVMTPEFVASVQRALKARQIYRGPITGEMDSRTRAAIRKYQKREGLDSGILSLAAARQFGLVAVMPEGAEAPPPKQTAADKAAEKAAAQAEKARLADEKRTAEDAEQAAALAAEQAAKDEQARRDAELAEAAQAKRDAELAQARKAEQIAKAEKAKRQAEVDAALEAESSAKEAKRTPLPISSESSESE